MSNGNASTVIIEDVGDDLRNTVEVIMGTLAPKSFAGSSVLIKPNMVGPSAPELGHTTHPELVRALVLSCLDRNGKVWVGDNPGGINRSSRNVAKITGILDASNGCFTPISERVVEKTGAETNFPLVISRAVMEADYIINVPIFKTHKPGFMSKPIIWECLPSLYVTYTRFAPRIYTSWMQSRR
jgi:uncharacterized protein (DUF362 family)